MSETRTQRRDRIERTYANGYGGGTEVQAHRTGLEATYDTAYREALRDVIAYFTDPDSMDLDYLALVRRDMESFAADKGIDLEGES